MEAESLTGVFGILRNKLYLYGLPYFILETDHKPLANLYKQLRKTCPPRIERHRLNLEGFNFDLQWKKGSQGNRDDPVPILSRKKAIKIKFR